MAENTGRAEVELKDEVGDDDAALKQLSQSSTEKVEQTVVQQIFHGTVCLASGNASMQVQNNTLTPGDWNQLAKIPNNAGCRINCRRGAI